MMKIEDNPKFGIAPSPEQSCECMMCTILKGLTKEESTSFPCLRRIPTIQLVQGGILSRKGQQSPVELPAGIPVEVLSQLRAELPVDVPVELTTMLPVETLVELPAPVPVELSDNEVKPLPQEINGIPISVVLLLRQIHKEEEERRASQDASPARDAEGPVSATISRTTSEDKDLPGPNIRFNVNKLIGEGKPQEWPHKKPEILVNVGKVERKGAVVQQTKNIVLTHKAEICNGGYVAFSPEYASPTPGKPYPPGSAPGYIPYRPWFAGAGGNSLR